jgi:CheY-like chemotaxis protein
MCALVVGEHAGMRRLLKLTLGSLALDVHEVCSNDSLQNALRKVPSVVVVDVDPSYRHGMVVWHLLRRHPVTANIPSLFLVEAGNEFIRRLATVAGATVCVEKPFHPRHVRTIVADLLSLASRPNVAEGRCSDIRGAAAL